MDQNTIPEAIPVTPPAPPAQTAPGASGRAVAALILGILSLMCMGFLTGIPAIILGQMELKAIRAGLAPAAGESTARVGQVLGIIGTIFTCLTILAVIVMVLLGISLGSMSEAVNSAGSV